MHIFDTHAHLDHLTNLDLALDNAKQAGVIGIVAMSVSLDSCRKNLEIKKSKSCPEIFLAMGTHPSDANLTQLDESIQFIREHSKELTAVGEIGLDFWYKWVRKDDVKKNEQRLVFRRHLELAKELDLPVVIHSRGVWRECLETTKSIGINRAEFHWYSGPIDVLKDILDAGFFVSTSPSVAYSVQSREAMSYAPIERTLIETDSPVYFKNPQTNEDGFQAEPKDVFQTLKAYCELKKIDEQSALEVLNNNARKFFGIDY